MPLLRKNKGGGVRACFVVVRFEKKPCRPPKLNEIYTTTTRTPPEIPAAVRGFVLSLAVGGGSCPPSPPRPQATSGIVKPARSRPWTSPSTGHLRPSDMPALSDPGAAHQSNIRATLAQQEYEQLARTITSASCATAAYRNRGGPPHASPGRAASGTFTSYPPGVLAAAAAAAAAGPRAG